MSLGPNAIHTARSALAVTPNDSTVLQAGIRALYVGGAGNVSVITVGGQTVTFVGVGAGSMLPIQVARVRATDTTATSILALI